MARLTDRDANHYAISLPQIFNEMGTNSEVLVYKHKYLFWSTGVNLIDNPCLFQESSAFVYGCASFVEKLANGVLVVVIQLFYPCPWVLRIYLKNLFEKKSISYQVVVVYVI